ncbi:MAG TPA: extracellular solute-binding protein, partial [Devosia sp.]|nr:extracellular solute-binding protein [Devosia sp.]
ISLINPDAKPVTDHWDYVNPNAPKGGLVRLSSLGGFDTFNPILPEGEPADGLGLVYETLMTSSLSDSNSSYPLIASALAFPPDISSTTFKINPKARWQDGTPVTPQDVVWSFEEEMKLNPNMQQYYQDVSKAEVTAPDEVTFTFSTTNNRELPVILGQLLVLPQHWWEGKDASGKQRDIGASTLEPPMGSGPYKMKTFNAGSSITYERDPNYWGASEPTQVGQNNFDEIRYEYFRDPDVAFEGFKGDQFDWWSENRAKRWATAYDFPAVQQKKVVQELFPQTYADSGVMVGFVFNLRLDKFKDVRVRHALQYAFDFESLNKTLFYGQYERINSYFYGLPFAGSGVPEGKELEILNTVKDKVPPEVFTSAYENPVAGDPQKLRANLKQALDLLTSAGYRLDGNRLVDAGGNQLSFEILLNGPTIEPVATAFQTNLKAIGIETTIRSVDSAEYINRMRSRDFEVTYNGWTQSLSPGNEQNFFFGSKAAADPSTSNYGGIADAAIDALINQVVFAKSRDDLIAATKALDRVLLAGYYVVPSYTLRKDRVARWDRFSHPDTLPQYSIGFPTIWWYDEAKAEKAGKAQ